MVQRRNEFLAFITFDDEHHRMVVFEDPERKPAEAGFRFLWERGPRPEGGGYVENRVLRVGQLKLTAMYREREWVLAR